MSNGCADSRRSHRRVDDPAPAQFEDVLTTVPSEFDRRALDDLTEFFHSDAVPRRFAEDFLSLASRRTAGIESAVADRNERTATVCLLSLRSAAAMIGAAALTQQCRRLEQTVHDGRWEATQTLLDDLVAAMTLTRHELTSWLAEPHPVAG